MNDYEQIVESAMLHEGCHEIVSTLLAEERKVEHLRIENELENENEVRRNNTRIFIEACERYQEACNNIHRHVILKSNDKQWNDKTVE